MKTTIGLINIKDGKILLVKKRETWILPGGKPEDSDMSDKETLLREFEEELPGTKISIGDFYKSFFGKTPHSKTELELRSYFGDVKNLGKSSAEISGVCYESDFVNCNLSENAKKAISSLKEDGYL
ncbi:MAG: NUDIX domain-containing protein [Candidatus Pacearchaeota archaeon]